MEGELLRHSVAEWESRLISEKMFSLQQLERWYVEQEYYWLIARFDDHEKFEHSRFVGIQEIG